MERLHPILAPLAAALTMACSATGGPSGTVTPAETPLLAQGAPAVVALPDGRALIEIDGALAIVRPRQPDLEPIVVGQASELGRVHAAVEDGEAILVLAEGGTFVLRGSSWVPSPLAASLDGPIRGAQRLSTPTGRGVGELWVLTESSLYRVEGTDEGARAARFGLDEDLGDARLAAIRRPEGPALWVLMSDRLLEIWRDRTGALRSAALGLEVLPTDIAGDASGRGWLVIDGTLHAFGDSRTLLDHRVEVDALVGDGRSDEVWAFGSETWLASQGRVYGVDVTPIQDDAARAILPDGSLVVATDAEVRRVSPRRDVTIEGPEDGAYLGVAAAVRIRAPGEPTIDVEIDGEALELADGQVTVDPAALGDGSYTLRVRVAYDDGTLEVVEERRFEIVASSTWSDDVEPIFAEQCASCHGPEGPANTRLDEPAEWEDEALSSKILTNVREGRMPLGRPPLSQREVAVIEAWMRNGFERGTEASE